MLPVYPSPVLVTLYRCPVGLFMRHVLPVDLALCYKVTIEVVSYALNEKVKK